MTRLGRRQIGPDPEFDRPREIRHFGNRQRNRAADDLDLEHRAREIERSGPRMGRLVSIILS
jgi:hypothetical protein